MTPRIFAVLPFIVTITTTEAQFTGDYAGDTWAIQAPVGGSASFAIDGGSLTIVGPDDLMYGSIDVTHVVTEDGTCSFTWTYTSLDSSSGWDYSYYLVNGESFFLAKTSFYAPPIIGRVSIDVQRGDVIGWGVVSTDGIFGPGTLAITNFQVPAPSTLALFGLALVGRRRRL